MRQRKLVLLACVFLLALSACTASGLAENGKQTEEKQPDPQLEQLEKEETKQTENKIAEVVEEKPTKLTPGCRVDLPYPLQMNGESTATDFSSWTAEDLEGNPVNQDILKGSKITLVSAWSTYCGSCLEDLAILQQLYEKYDREHLNIIGIVASSQNLDGSPKVGEIEAAKLFAESVGAEFLQLLPSDDLISIKLKDVHIVPEFFLLDGDGRLIGETQTGARSLEELDQMVQDGLKTIG